jgi:hypothetical protein
MPYMQDWPQPMDSRRASPASETSSTSSCHSPASGTTDSTSVSWIQDASIYHKRKREPLECLSRKRPRMEPLSNGHYIPPAPGGEVKGASRLAAQADEEKSALDMDASSGVCAVLPAQLWHRVFMYLPPQSLGQLLLVNQTFNSYLQAADVRQSPDPTDGEIRNVDHLDPEKIWIQSRRLFHRHLPRPLHGRSELDMWKLIGGRSCQLCAQKLGSTAQPGQQNDSAIRGSEGQAVRVFWPLAIRCCNTCLRNETFTVCQISHHRENRNASRQRL